MINTFYGPRGQMTIGELRELTANTPDHYTIFTTRGARYYDVVETVYAVRVQPEGAAIVELGVEDVWTGKHPDDIIGELEDRVDVLNDCLKRINDHFKDPMSKEVAELYESIKFYLDPL